MVMMLRGCRMKCPLGASMRLSGFFLQNIALEGIAAIAAH
jgi:hypothetical protein